jgi:hypothetical protein
MFKKHIIKTVALCFCLLPNGMATASLFSAIACFQSFSCDYVATVLIGLNWFSISVQNSDFGFIHVFMGLHHIT